jgi:uncharacterized protein YndB with AHSA1/START domain
MRFHIPTAAAALTLLMSCTATADVVDKAASGFTVKVTSSVTAPSTRVYDAIVRIGSWWESDHTYSGSAANLSLDPKAGGCFCEKLPNGGSVQHMTVVYAESGKLLRLDGGLGPLQDLAVTGKMTWVLTATGGKTTIELTYKVGGYMPGGVDALAQPVDAVLSAQVARLKALVESGK